MLKYVNADIVFQEIPDEVTLAVNIANCPCRCPGCHSPYLWKDVGEPLTTDVIDRMMAQYGCDFTCLCFMGGDVAPKEVEMLARYVKGHYKEKRVAWYSGRIRIPDTIDTTVFDYVKIGPFIRHLGGLKSPTTNQRLYKRTNNGNLQDITHRFWPTSRTHG